MNMADGIQLKVSEAHQNDVTRGLVRIDSQARKALDITTGDIVEIKGKKLTCAIVWQAHPSDEGLGIIRMEGSLRQNASVGLGDKVFVKKAEVKEARKVVLAPNQPMRFNPGFSEYVKNRLAGRPVVKGDMVILPIWGTAVQLQVVTTTPQGITQINENTQIETREEPAQELSKVSPITYEDIGGMKNEVQKVREMVELPLRHPELFERLGIESPKGVLLYGSPGTGKTLLAKAVANESEANFISINGPELVSKFVGESEKQMRDLFEEAEKNAPTIIFMDELDAIAPKREETVGEVERRMVSQLLTLMDGLKGRGQVIVIAATNRVNAIDPALRRPGRFDREIEIGIPDRNARKEILQIHTRNMPLDKDVNLDELANITYGYTGADIWSLAKEAAMRRLRKILPDINLEEEFIPQTILDNLKVTREDFQEAMRDILPSAMREVFVEIPNVHWDEIGGLDDVKAQLKEAVELPLKSPEIFGKLGIKPIKGILLTGLPGTGKTLLAKAVATESQSNFISVKGPEFMSKWVGESIAYDEPVWIREKDGNIKRIEIGRLGEEKTSPVEAGNEIQFAAQETEFCTFTLDENGKAIVAPVAGFIKHKNAPKELYKVTTQTGREIKTTADHALFTLMNGFVTAIPTNKLIAGESYIAVPARLPTLEIEKSWDLVELLKDDKKVLVKPNLLFAKAVAKLGVDKVSEILKLSKRYVAENIARAKNALPLPQFHKLMKEAGMEFDSNEIILGYKTSKGVLPGRINSNRDLCYVIGFWVAEGDYNRKSLRFSNHDEGNRKELYEALVRLGVEPKAFKECIRAEHPLLQTFFHEVVKLAPYAKNKHAPEFMFSAPRAQIAAFLRGYYSGDGSVYGNSHRSIIEASTSSLTLARDVQHLLLHFGIVAKLWRGREKLNDSDKFKVLFSGVTNFEHFLEIGFSQQKKQERLVAYPAAKKWKRSTQVPLGQSMRELLKQNGYAEWAESTTIGIDKLKQFLEKNDPERKMKEIWQIIESDYYWDKVVKIEKVAYDKPYIYDISVPVSQRFIAGYGDILVHNSEKMVRELFRKARQAAPCIVFIDELDAVASRRGMDVGERVTEKVVNSLLLELDGAQNLKDVVVIGATNRPDIIDPALLRPGRFDTLIELPLPDEKTRLAIFKVHTKNMPVAKDVDLELLTKKTAGYTGADIYGVCREAGMNVIREGGKNKLVVEMKHFNKALKEMKPTLAEKKIETAVKAPQGSETLYR